MNLSDIYMLTGQAAALLMVNRLTVQRWVKTGRLRGERVGYVTLIDKQQVEQIATERGQVEAALKLGSEAK